jgi:hypothetical protein
VLYTLLISSSLTWSSNCVWRGVQIMNIYTRYFLKNKNKEVCLALSLAYLRITLRQFRSVILYGTAGLSVFPCSPLGIQKC